MDVLASIAYTKGARIGVGQGMNSEVFLANDPQLGAQIAVKEIEKAKLINSVTAFFAEAQAVYAVAHKNVVPIHYACATNSHVCLAMPYYKAGSLADQIKAGPLPMSRLLKMGHDVLAGAAHTHIRGFLHLDIKPSNVLFADNGTALISDFGQARQITVTGTVKMPFMYPTAIPPEARLTGAVSVESDIYQIGLLLYRAANGNPFYVDQKPTIDLVKQVLSGKFPRRDRFMPPVPRRLRTVIRKALEVLPGRRYRNAAEMESALGTVTYAIDWEMTPLASGGLQWTGKRDGQSAIEVALLPGSSDWKVEVHTQGATTRAKGRADYWRKGLKRPAALVHLREVFQDLS